MVRRDAMLAAQGATAKDVPGALAAAKRAIGFDEGFGSEDTLGVADLQSGDAADALSNLMKAHDLAETGKRSEGGAYLRKAADLARAAGDVNLYGQITHVQRQLGNQSGFTT